MNPKEFNVILSHGPNCVDGAMAMWCFWRKFSQTDKKMLATEGGFYSYKSKNIKDKKYVHPNSIEGALAMQAKGYKTVFVFVQHSDQIPESLILNKKVAILDVDFGEQLANIVDKASKVLLIDHHDSTLASLQNLAAKITKKKEEKFSYCVDTSNTESAASLAWKLIENTNVHPLLDIVRIGDIWDFDNNPHAKYILKSLNLRRSFKSFQHIDNLFNGWFKNYNVYLNEGKIVLEHSNSIINKIAKQCSLGYIETNDGSIYTVAYVQCNVLHSDVGATLKKYAVARFKINIDFCITWKYAPHKNIVSVSLRNDDTAINLSDIAKNIKGSDGNGGGHKDSAAFYFSGIENLHKFILKEHPLYKTTYYNTEY
jgi:oligoribonuclease NrnB/cAMP/cGMP phosphodiesterase (DHH superfamily)